MKLRHLAALAALALSAGAFGQSLTLTNLKGPVAKACNATPAKSIADLWKQLGACNQPSPSPAATPPPAAGSVGPVTPITAVTDIAPFLTPGYARPNGGNIPELEPGKEVGAFRIICTPSHANYDDAILYPGMKGGSPHGHMNYGNTLTDASSTYASLRTTGEGTCSNKLNRSAYWAPWLQNEAGKIIWPDFIFNYYKRIPASDPRCKQRAAKGCAPFPTGLRAVTGYDMKRMGKPQPENAVFSHRCITDGKPSLLRPTLTDAIADCGGEGQIISSISFGDCWDGRTDSPDHRSHLAFGGYGDWGYYKCDAAHPYLITQLTQQYGYTIKKTDGVVRYSCDVMNGMTLPPGTCFHADVMEAWEPVVHALFETQCINRQLSCVDGELGDGTMLKFPASRKILADPRLIDPPAR